MADGDGDEVGDIGMAGSTMRGAVPELVGERLAKHKAVIAAKGAMEILAIFVTAPPLPPLRTRRRRLGQFPANDFDILRRDFGGFQAGSRDNAAPIGSHR